MVENALWLVCVFGCGFVFFGISVFAEKRTQPMWFWAGKPVSSKTISDVKEYNRENARMWRNYSLTFFVSGATYFYDPIIALVILALSCTVGIGWLVITYRKILEKYKCEPPKEYPKKKKKR